VALSNTTVGILLATIDSSIMLISLPEIFRGIRLNPLAPGNTFYLLWMILSFQIVSSAAWWSASAASVTFLAASKCIISAM
jgi:hypothetical protein